MIYQEEVCPETGREHLQGYVEFNTSVRFGALKKLPHMAKVHWEKRRGSRQQAHDYCCKEDTRSPDSPLQFEYGDFKRTSGNAGDRLKFVVADIQGGKRLKDIVQGQEIDLGFRYYGCINQLVVDFTVLKERNTRVTVCFGEPGMGEGCGIYPNSTRTNIT